MKKRIVCIFCVAAFVCSLLVFVGGSLALPPPEPLPSFNCSGGVVSIGDTASDVTAKCGEPSRVKEIGSGFFKQEQWIYNFTKAKKIYFLQFQGGKLQKIESAE